MRDPGAIDIKATVDLDKVAVYSHDFYTIFHESWVISRHVAKSNPVKKVL